MASQPGSASRWSDAALRRGALATFAVSIAMSVAAIALNAGIDGRPGLSAKYSPLDLELVAVGAVVVAVALLLSWARPRNPVGWLLAVSGLFGAACNLAQTYGTRAIVVPDEGLPLGSYALALSAPLWIPSLVIPGTVLLARYPSGRLTGRWAGRFDRAAVTGLVGVLVVYATSDNAVTDEVAGHGNPLHIPKAAMVAIAVPSAVLLAVGVAGVIVTSVVRMFRATYPERQQLAWLFTTALAAVALVIFTPIQELGTAAYAMVAVAIAVGVLRYRLLGIEVVVRRTLVYGTLTGLVLAVFVAVTAGLAEVTSGGVVPQLLAACLIAVGAVPARDRLQRVVDRFVYGDRRDPWSALERLSTPMGSSAGDVVPAVVAAVAGALRAPGAAVVGPDGAAIAEHGELAGVPVRVPLRFAGDEMGVLAVAPRRGEYSLGRADERLLDAVAPLIAAVVHAERLAADLRAERARVVTATEAERRRLRQELHDGLGPSLTGVGLGLEAVETRTVGGADPHTAELLGRLRAEVSAALQEIRRIIDDLRPAVFDELDLVTALRRRSEQITMSGALTVDVAAPLLARRLAPEYETAIYRIADEALTNVVRHASATRCDVQLRVDGVVRLVVADDGVGMIARVDGSGRGGVGLTSMRQRAERLGGTLTVERRSPGTAIVVDLPAAEPT